MAQQPSGAQLMLFFPTYVMADSWELADEHGPALRDTILARQAAGPGVTLSNMLGWRSDNDMTAWGGAAAELLSDHIARQADVATIDKLQTTPQRRFHWAAEMWAEVGGDHASTQIHSHPGAFWSALYFVDDGYAGSADPALGGELIFLDPRLPMVRTRAPDLRPRRADGQEDQHEVRMRPETGQIVMFPSWLAHGARPLHGGGERIAIGLNLAARPAR